MLWLLVTPTGGISWTSRCPRRSCRCCATWAPAVRGSQTSVTSSGRISRVTAMLHDTDGTAQGVFAMAAESLPQRIASVADQVQERAVEALWRAGSAQGQGT